LFARSVIDERVHEVTCAPRRRATSVETTGKIDDALETPGLRHDFASLDLEVVETALQYEQRVPVGHVRHLHLPEQPQEARITAQTVLEALVRALRDHAKLTTV